MEMDDAFGFTLEQNHVVAYSINTYSLYLHFQQNPHYGGGEKCNFGRIFFFLIFPLCKVKQWDPLWSYYKA